MTTSSGNEIPLSLRTQSRAEDREAIRRIVASTGMFNAQEVEIAVELVTERWERGDASGYYFVYADRGSETLGYACYGPIAGTARSFDLYWIAVEKKAQGQGIGRRLLLTVEASIQSRGGGRIYVETSGKPFYEPTRAFYEQSGYELAATLADFYAPGDDKVVYLKVV